MCACMLALQSDIHNDLPKEQKQSNDPSMSPGVLRFVALLQNNTYTAASLHDHIDLDFPLNDASERASYSSPLPPAVLTVLPAATRQ